MCVCVCVCVNKANVDSQLLTGADRRSTSCVRSRDGLITTEMLAMPGNI